MSEPKAVDAVEYWSHPSQNVCATYLFSRGAKNLGTDELGLAIILPSAFGISLFFSIMWLYPLGPLAKKRIEGGHVVLAHGAGNKLDDVETDTELASGHPVHHDDESAGKPAGKPTESDVKGDSIESEEEVEEAEKEEEKIEADEVKPSFAGSLRKMSQSFADSTYNQDLHEQSMAENAKAKEIWDNAELYDEKAEMMFTYVQVFTACLNSFAHGGKKKKWLSFIHCSILPL